jgi:hypothetical protein
MSKNNEVGQAYIPTKLPCGKLINQNYKPGMKMESCRTVCPDKSNIDIDHCYDSLKPKEQPLSHYGMDMTNTNPKDRLFSH